MVIKLNNFKLSELSNRRLKGVEDRGIELVKRALELSPVDFGVAFNGGLRSSKVQYELYKNKFSTKDGYTKVSKHQIGKAIDFLPYVNGKVDLRKHNYYLIITAFLIAAAELNLKIRSGSNWDNDSEFITDQEFQDLPHIEWT